MNYKAFLHGLLAKIKSKLLYTERGEQSWR